MRYPAIASVIVGLVLTACGDGPSCEELARHVDELARREAGSSGLTVADHAALVRNCEAERASNRTMRDCIMRATSLIDAKGCELAAIKR